MLTIVMVMLIFMPKTLAKYSTSEKLLNQIDIAEPIFIVEGKETTKISEINNIGYYEFSVKNYNDTNISEISFPIGPNNSIKASNIWICNLQKPKIYT